MASELADFFQTKTGQRLLHNLCRIADALEEIRDAVVNVTTPPEPLSFIDATDEGRLKIRLTKDDGV